MTRRYKTTLRFESGHYVPTQGETLIMQRELSGIYTAVTIWRIYRTREHPDEPGVTLMDATIVTRDLPAGAGLFLAVPEQQQTVEGGE